MRVKMTLTVVVDLNPEDYENADGEPMSGEEMLDDLQRSLDEGDIDLSDYFDKSESYVFDVAETPDEDINLP